MGKELITGKMNAFPSPHSLIWNLLLTYPNWIEISRRKEPPHTTHLFVSRLKISLRKSVQCIAKDKDDRNARTARGQRRIVPAGLQMATSHSIHTIHKMNPRWPRYLNVRAKTKLLFCF